MTKRLVLAAVLVSSLLAACGKQDNSPPANSGEPTTTTSTTEAPTTTVAAAAASKVTLDAAEYSYTFGAGSPTIPAGPVELELDNKGKEEHQATIIKLKDGKTFDDLAALGSDPSKLATVVDTYGGPNAVAPEGSNTTIQDLAPGSYFFACFIPAADGVPHAAKGMIAPFTVEGTAPAPSAASPNTIALKDYAFGVDASIAAGTYTFTNQGPQPHEAALYTPLAGKTTKDILDWFASPTPTGPVPYESAGGIAAVGPGGSVSTDLTAGDYVFVCFIPDAADGAPHFVHGMIHEVTVK